MTDEKRNLWFIIARKFSSIIAGGVFTLLRLTGGSHTAIDRDRNQRSRKQQCAGGYFSWSGNGQQMAGRIAPERDRWELVQILTEPYSDDFDSTMPRAQTELNNETRPAYHPTSTQVMAGYDVIYRLSNLVIRPANTRSGVSWRI